MSKKVKVAGYTKKINYDGDISYRPFNPIVKSRPDAIFTHGNFSVTTNIDENKTWELPDDSYSEYVTLSDLEIPYIAENIVTEQNNMAVLNLDWSDLKNHAYFGSLRERFRVVIESIINKYPSSVIVYPYDENFDAQETFRLISSTSIESIIQINWLCEHKNPGGVRLTSDVMDVSETYYKDLITNPSAFILVIGDNEYDIVSYGSFDGLSYDLKVSGDLSSVLPDQKIVITPKINVFNDYFDKISPLEKQLISLDKQNTYNFLVREFSDDNGVFIETKTSGKWVMSDGYNLDIDTPQFEEYVEELMRICDKHDEDVSNLILRRLVTASIIEFDTNYDVDDEDNIINTAQKIKILLSVYGRHFDIIKNYIDSLKVLNTVTYDNVNNTPDNFIKYIFNGSGWELFDLTALNDEITGYVTEKKSIDALKLLLLNTPYVWSGKGTRKIIEFINDFFGIPRSLINFNEHVYVVENNLSVEEYEKRLIQGDASDVISENEDLVDDDGYPRILPNTDDDYFQKGGKWFRDTTGEFKNKLISSNNPHEILNDVGYFEKYREILPSDNQSSVIESIIEKSTILLTSNYNDGSETFRTMTTSPLIINSITEFKETIEPELLVNECGCEIIENVNKELVISANYAKNSFNCGYQIAEFNDESGIINFYTKTNNVSTLVNVTSECCSALSGEMVYSYTLERNVCVHNIKAYKDCAKYQATSVSGSNISAEGYLYFTDLSTNTVVTSIPYSECCPSGSESRYYNDGYGCFKGTSINGKCIVIDKITFSKANTETNEHILSYTNALTTSTVNYEIIGENGSVVSLNLISSANKPLSFKYMGGATTVNYADFISNSGSTIIDLNKTFILKVYYPSPYNTDYILITYRYVDCPEIDYSLACVKITDLTIHDNSTNNNDIKLFYKDIGGSVENVMVINENSKLVNVSIEEYGQLITELSNNLTIVYNNNTGNASSTTIALRDKIDIAYWSVNNDNVYTFVTNVGGVQIMVHYKFTECVNCVGLDPYMSTEIDGVQYLVFKNNATNAITSTVNYPQCCPSFSRVVEYQSGYRCAYDMTEPTTECDTIKSAVTETTINRITNLELGENIVFYAGFGMVASDGIWTSSTKMTLLVDGDYSIEFSGFANHEYTTTINGYSEIKYMPVYLYAYVNGVKADAQSMSMTFYESSITGLESNTKYITLPGLKAGDTLEFRATSYIYEGESYIRSNVENGKFKLMTTETICGCDVNVSSIGYLYNNNGISGNAIFESFTKRETTNMVITPNGGSSSVFPISLIKGYGVNNNYGIINISDDTEIRFSNALQGGESYQFASLQDNDLVLYGRDIKNLTYNTLRVLFNGYDGAYIYEFTFDFSGCSIPETKKYTVSTTKESTNFIYETPYGGSVLTIYDLVVTSATEIYGLFTGSATPYGDTNLSVASNSGIKMYEIIDGAVSVNETNTLTSVGSGDTCNEQTSTVNAYFKLVVSPGTYKITLSSLPGTTTCLGGNAQVLSCGLTEAESNYQTYGNVQIRLYSDSTMTKIVYYSEKSSVNYCRYGLDNGSL